jgi:processive 1,2-diacylglycerol beta-glucosyltransferase
MTTRILFLYISMSSGHQRAAEAIREALSLLTPSWETTGVDAFSYAYPKIGKLIARTYLEVLRRTPMLWDYVYDNPDVEAATREARDLLNLISARRMKTLFRKHSPQAIVCTQAAPCSVFAAEKRRGYITVPLIAVVTDFAIHSYWVYDEVDLYCVSSEDARRELIRRGVNAAKIAVTGIPISPNFLQRLPPASARVKLGLEPNRPTVLIMGGSQGLGPLQETLDHLHGLPVQCVVTTGMNRELFRTLHKHYRRDKKVKLFGYTRQINTFMDASDILITKPGGLTSSEALAKGLPMIITNPIPGQEERNARYLLKQGVAERADDPEKIRDAVQSLLAHPTRLRRMTERALEIAKPYAAMEVARHLFRIVSAHRPQAGPTLRNRGDGRSGTARFLKKWGSVSGA